MFSLSSNPHNAHTRCDYHAENLGHSTENCTALKHKIQDLINDGKLNFEDLDRPTEVKGLSRTNVKMTRQKKEIPKEANFWKAAIPKGKVPFAKVRRSEEGFSLTIEESTERSRKPSGEEEQKVL